MDTRLFSRLGTMPPIDETATSEPEVAEPPRLGISVALDRPFHELKQFLVEEFERAYLTRCLDESHMNLSRASRCSGLSRKHIRTLMAKYGMATRRTLILDE